MTATISTWCNSQGLRFPKDEVFDDKIREEEW